MASVSWRAPRRLPLRLVWRKPRYILWALLIFLIGLPMAMLIAMSLNTGDPEALYPRELGFSNYARLGSAASPLWDTIVVAVGVMALSTGLGVGLAWIVARTTIRHKGILTLFIILPYPMGAMVIALAWASLGSPHGGLLNSWLGIVGGQDQLSIVNAYSTIGIILVQSLFQTPVTYLLAHSALQNMDSSLEEASDILGARKASTAIRITMPLMLPAVLGAALFAFVSALGAFAIPTVLGRQTELRVVTYEVYLLVSGFPTDYPLAAALGVVLVAISAVAVTVANKILRSRTHAVIGGKSNRRRPVDVGRWRYLLATIVYTYIAVAVVLPIVALVIASLQQTSSLDVTHLTWTLHNYIYALVEYPATQSAVLNSLMIGIATGIIGVTLAAIIAITVEKGRRAGGLAKGMEQITMVPQAVPRLIFTVPLLTLILLSPIVIYGTLTAITVSYVIVFLPLAYRGMAAVVAQSHPSLEEAARTLGASSFKATMNISVPLLKSGFLTGSALLFMVSFSELGASILLTTTSSRVLGPTMFSFYDSGGISLVSALAIIQTIIVLGAIVIARKVGDKFMTS